jgi:uncharacterized protein
MRKLLVFTLVGVFAQLVDGTLGMAYGVTASSLLLANGASAATASASVHLAEIGTSLASGVSHWRFGNVDWTVVRLLAAPGAVGAFFGARMLVGFDGNAVRPYIAALLVVLGLTVFVRSLRNARAANERSTGPVRRSRIVPLGLVGGFVDAIGGGGWGPITTPTLISVERFQPRKAVGSAAASEFVVSLAATGGFLTAFREQSIDGRIVAGLLIGGVVAAPCAAWLVRHINARCLGLLVGMTLVAINARTLAVEAGAPAIVQLVLVAVLLGAALIVAIACRRRAPSNHSSDVVTADAVLRQ